MPDPAAQGAEERWTARFARIWLKLWNNYGATRALIEVEAERDAALSRAQEAEAERDKSDDEAERLGIERAEAWAERDALRARLEAVEGALRRIEETGHTKVRCSLHGGKFGGEDGSCDCMTKLDADEKMREIAHAALNPTEQRGSDG